MAGNKPRSTTGPTTNAYQLRDLPLEEVIKEVEMRIYRLKTLDSFSNSDCSEDLKYLNAATRCGSNPQVNSDMHSGTLKTAPRLRCFVKGKLHSKLTLRFF